MSILLTTLFSWAERRGKTEFSAQLTELTSELTLFSATKISSWKIVLSPVFSFHIPGRGKHKQPWEVHQRMWFSDRHCLLTAHHLLQAILYYLGDVQKMLCLSWDIVLRHYLLWPPFSTWVPIAQKVKSKKILLGAHIFFSFCLSFTSIKSRMVLMVLAKHMEAHSSLLREHVLLSRCTGPRHLTFKRGMLQVLPFYIITAKLNVW